MPKHKTKKDQKNKRNSKHRTHFNGHERKLFVIVFVATFAVVSALTISFPNFRSVLYGSSSGLDGVLLAKNTKVTGEAHAAATIFTDVPNNHPNVEAITYLKTKGVISGYADGSFKPDGHVNRAELLKFIGAALGVSPLGLSNSFCFKDVKDEWFAPYACYAKTKGWVGGFSDGTFHPAADVTRAESLKMVLAAWGTKLVDVQPALAFSDVHSQDWFAKYVWTAQDNNWLEQTPEQGAFNGKDPMTRAHVAELLYRVLSQQLPTI